MCPQDVRSVVGRRDAHGRRQQAGLEMKLLPSGPKFALALGSSAVVLSQVAKVPTNLFLYHPLLAALIIPSSTAATIAVRSRIEAARAAAKDSGSRGRQVLERRIKAHFAFNVVATLSALGAVSAIAANKARLGKSHLLSTHSRIGAASVVIWLGALLVAEKNVWKNGIPRIVKGRGFVYEPRWKWSSKNHRRLGIAAFYAMICTVASGLLLTPYGKALPGQTTALAALAVTATSMAL